MDEIFTLAEQFGVKEIMPGEFALQIRTVEGRTVGFLIRAEKLEDLASLCQTALEQSQVPAR